jgi:hypothetical protein
MMANSIWHVYVYGSIRSNDVQPEKLIFQSTGQQAEWLDPLSIFKRPDTARSSDGAKAWANYFNHLTERGDY